MKKVICMIFVLASFSGCADPVVTTRAPIVDHSVAANNVRVSAPAATPDVEDNRRDLPAQTHALVDSPTVQVKSAPPVQTPQGGQIEKDWRPRTYTVQLHDTLYGIAFNFGLDYRDLAELNHIPNPAYIQAGQVIRLFPEEGGGSMPGNGTSVKPGAAASAGVPVKEGPLSVKQPYSEQNLAQTAGGEPNGKGGSGKGGGAKAAASGVAEAATSGVDVTAGVPGGNVAVKWEMPASGKVIATFSEAENRKGIDIAGKRGQSVFASAPGKVVYSGSGLRGYGKLVIIKHDAIYLSAYAHNDKLMVKEGQMVSKGQLIAQMGSTDSDRVALHFEIRKLGKPVDPAKYLTMPKP